MKTHEYGKSMQIVQYLLFKIVTYRFFKSYYFLGAPNTNEQKNMTQRERNSAQFKSNFAQIECNLKTLVHCAKIHSQIRLLFWIATTFLWNVIKPVETTTVQSVSFFPAQMDVHVITCNCMYEIDRNQFWDCHRSCCFSACSSQNSKKQNISKLVLTLPASCCILLT